MVVDNLAAHHPLVHKLQHCLSNQLYEEACVLLKMPGAMVVTWEEDNNLDKISNAAWRRLQILPEKTQRRVELALSRGDFDFVAQILKSF